MAVIQISKIQVRRGRTGDQKMPTLASGEFGWSVDNQELYIGNGSVEEGAPAIGNTQILTEHSLFEALSKAASLNYTYKGNNPDIIIQTGIDSEFPIERTIQQKLDDNVSILDFGATDKFDITAEVQHAIDELYDNTDKDQAISRKTLKWPAGEYYISQPIRVPSYATLIGDGIDKTVLVSINTTGNTTIFATVNDDGETCINNDDALIQPRNVKISGFTLKHFGASAIEQSKPLMIVDGLKDSEISNIKFKGLYEKGDAFNLDYNGIDLVSHLTENCVIKDSIFEDLCAPIVSNWDVKNIRITDNKFVGHQQGITFATDILGICPKQWGPRNISIEDNYFENIEKEAIIAGANTGTNNHIVSENNTYVNVGNSLLGDDEPSTSIIKFSSHGNSSINDNFQRLWFAQTAAGATARQQPVVEGTAQIRQKFTDRRVLPASTQTQTLVRIPFDGEVTGVDIGYTIQKASISRKGSISVVASNSGVSLRDSYAVAGNNDGDIVFSAELVDTEDLGNNDTLAVKYLNAVGTATCILNISYYR
jgi:hypothetical protein